MQDLEKYYEQTTVLTFMLRTSNLVASVFERTTGVHIAHWRVLAFLSANANCTQKDLKEAHRVDPSSITRTVKALEADGLVIRRTDKNDNRLTRVALTAAGRRVVTRVTERRKLYLRHALKELSPEEIESFGRILERLERNAIAMSRDKTLTAPG